MPYRKKLGAISQPVGGIWPIINKYMITDYSYPQHFFRLEMDIPLKPKDFKKVRTLLDAQNWTGAYNALVNTVQIKGKPHALKALEAAFGK